MAPTRRTALGEIFMLALVACRPLGGGLNWAERLVAAARDQIGVTRTYDPGYAGLAYPGGDIPRVRGVCTDVVVRAYRDAFGLDLQSAVHEDMSAHFDAYPANWGLSAPDPNIDHRRVPNLETFLRRRGLEYSARNWRPGDLLTCRIDGRLAHIAIISDRPARDGRWAAIHNIGRGAEETALIGRFSSERRFRFPPLAA